MKLNLEPKSEEDLRDLAGRAGVTLERYANDVLAAHIEYERWFVMAVEKGLKDVAEGRVLSPEQSKQDDEARRAYLSSRQRKG